MSSEWQTPPPASATGTPKSWNASDADRAEMVEHLTLMVEYLTLEDALSLIEDLAVGPVRDLGLLDSALHRPATMLWGHDAYATIDEKAAALLDSLVRNHPLVDGNKRLGWLATLVFLDINGHWVEAPDDDAYRLVMDVAAGKLSLKEITAALSQWHDRGSE